MQNTATPQPKTFKQLQARIVFYLIIFFILFGSASLYLLLRSPA